MKSEPVSDASAQTGPKAGPLAFILRELAEAIPATIFFIIAFNVIALTTQLILADYLIHFANFLLVTFSALIVGKGVLLANKLPFFRRFDTAPIIQPILFKTLIYCAVIFVIRVLEKVVKYFFTGGNLGGIQEYLSAHFSWNRFIAIQIWIFVLFLIYTAAAELDHMFGQGELIKFLFTRRSSELKLSRRQRVRALVKLGRLTEKHTLDELHDRDTPAHNEMIDLITKLATRKQPTRK